VTTVDGWTAEQWTNECRHLRDALSALGVVVPSCLPGEPRDCGEPLLDHYISYLALLNARVVVMAQANLNPAQQDDFTQRVHDLHEQYEAEAGEHEYRERLLAEAEQRRRAGDEQQGPAGS